MRTGDLIVSFDSEFFNIMFSEMIELILLFQNPSLLYITINLRNYT